MFSIPRAAGPLLSAVIDAGVFTRPTLRRFVALVTGLIVTMGRRTVSHSIVAVEPLLDGHWSNYHRLYSSAKFSMACLAAVLVRRVVALLPADAVIRLAADDTVDGKAGDRVWAKSAHRDPVRSTRSKAAVKYGHKWLVMCVLVQLEGWDRPWALPVMCGLCVSPKAAGAIKRRPKTASRLARQMLARLMRWLPDRTFVLTGDYQVVTHRTAAFARRHAGRVTVVGRMRGDANLYAAPADPNRRSRCGGPAKKGRKLAPPSEQVKALPVTEREVAWYGGGRRAVRHVTDRALWYDKRDNAVTPVRWVCVPGDPGQNRADAYFFCSDVAATAAWVIEQYVLRWNVEVTFEESRALLGLETTRHWCERSVLRVTPILLGLFSVVALTWRELHAARRRIVSTATPCYGKTRVTFADALAAVRRELWETTLLRQRGNARCLTRLPRRLRKTILWHLSAAA